MEILSKDFWGWGSQSNWALSTWDPVGPVRNGKRLESRKWGKDGKQGGKPPRAWQGQNMVQKWPGNEEKWKIPSKIHLSAIFAIFTGAVLHLVFHFSPFPAFQPFSIPYRPNRIQTFNLQNSSVSAHNLHFMVCAPLISGTPFRR